MLKDRWRENRHLCRSTARWNWTWTGTSVGGDANSIGHLGAWKEDINDGRSVGTARQRVGRPGGFAGEEMLKSMGTKSS